MNDSTSIVRVTRYFKDVTSRDPVTNIPTTYQVMLDWGIGMADDGSEGYYFYGSPYQFFTPSGTGGIFGDPTKDARVLVVGERMTLSTLPDQAAPGYGTDTVHYKNPNI